MIRLRLAGALCAALLLAAIAEPAHATENGASIYLLGSGGPETAIMAPVTGVFFDNTLYFLNGEIGGGRQFSLGGNVVADVEADVVADFATFLWVPTTHFAGGTLGLGAAIPFGDSSVDVSAVITGPLGGQVGVSRSDSAFILGDPILLAQLGWHRGNVHWQASTMVNVPIGDYREDQLANLAFHRWAADFSFAGTWHNQASGWDVSGKAGFTFNGENDHTDYESGTEFHLEGSVEKTFSPSWAAGLQAYYFNQVTGDSGAGAALGSFEGEVTGIGATVAYHFPIGQAPATLRLRAMTEFDAVNRPESDTAWIELSMPLHMNVPPAAAHE